MKLNWNPDTMKEQILKWKKFAKQAYDYVKENSETMYKKFKPHRHRV